MYVLGINNFKSQESLKEKEVTIAGDNDAHKAHPHLEKTLREAATLHQAIIIKPQRAGQDFNDVLQKEGIDAVRQSFGLLDKQTEEILFKIAAFDTAFDLSETRHQILEAGGNLGNLFELYINAYKAHAREAYQSFLEERRDAKNIEEVMTVLEKERSYALGAKEEHPGIVQTNDQVMHQLTLYGDNPNFLEDLTSHIKIARHLEVRSEKDIFNMIHENPNITEASVDLKNLCSHKIKRIIDEERQIIKKEGVLEKEGHTYRSELAYLEKTLSDKAINPYITEEKKKILMQEVSSLKEAHTQGRGLEDGLTHDFGTKDFGRSR